MTQLTKFTEDGDRHFADQGRVAEITLDLVSQARAKMSEDTVKGPEDAIVSEVINQLPQENILRNHKMLSRTIHGAGRCAQFMEDRETHLPAETRCSTEDRDKKLQGFCADVGDVEVVCDLCHSPPGKRKEPEGWKQLRVGI